MLCREPAPLVHVVRRESCIVFKFILLLISINPIRVPMLTCEREGPMQLHIYAESSITMLPNAECCMSSKREIVRVGKCTFVAGERLPAGGALDVQTINSAVAASSAQLLPSWSL